VSKPPSPGWLRVRKFTKRLSKPGTAAELRHSVSEAVRGSPAQGGFPLPEEPGKKKSCCSEHGWLQGLGIPSSSPPVFLLRKGPLFRSCTSKATEPSSMCREGVASSSGSVGAWLSSEEPERQMATCPWGAQKML
uniref:Uncharacterized protein n=1 Tax=Laticauda laticaudata TaxID=8630 RepID=A0A8C5RJQ7_LATLA